MLAHASHPHDVCKCTVRLLVCTQTDCLWKRQVRFNIYIYTYVDMYGEFPKFFESLDFYHKSEILKTLKQKSKTTTTQHASEEFEGLPTLPHSYPGCAKTQKQNKKTKLFQICCGDKNLRGAPVQS